MAKVVKKSQKPKANKTIKSISIKEDLNNQTFNNPEDAVLWIKNHLPIQSSKAKIALKIIEEAILNIPKTCVGQREQNILDLLKRSLLKKDIKFLAKQISYNIMAASDIPTVFTDPDKLLPTIDDILDYLVQTTPRASSFAIRIEGYPLRGQPGIKCSFTITNPGIKSSDETELLSDAFLSQENSPLAKCRQIFASQGGQLWMEIPKQDTILLNFVLPSLSNNQLPIKQEVFRYEINLTNFQSIRKRFGRQKALHLLKEIERFVKTIVRYPFDIVVSSFDKSLITTIYETPAGASGSVANRISHKLATEKFYIGKYLIDIGFKYKLTELSS